MIKKQNTVFISLIAIGVVVFAGYQGFGWKNYIDGFMKNLETVPIAQDSESESLKKEAWQTLEEYMAYAKAHDFEGVKRLAYQLSETCTNESTREECFALMDSVYAFFSFFKQEDFKNVLTDGRKILLFTDNIDDARIAYRFSRDENGEIKVAGMKICSGNGTTPDACSSL